MSTRPPPPTGAPPSYAFVARVYRRSLRPVAMTAAFVAALWSFLWGASALYDLDSKSSVNNVNIALGVIYLVIGVIEVFGFIVCMKSMLPGVRIYTYLTILAALMVVAAESLRFATYFTHKGSLIDTCTGQATGEIVYRYGSFWGTRASVDILDADEARTYCNSRWTHSVWTSVAWLIIATLLGWFFVSLAFSYYHQLVSPQPLAPSQAYRMNNFGQHNVYDPQGGYSYPAPPGPPPQREDYVPPYDPNKVPDYEEAGYGARNFGDVKEGHIPARSTDDLRSEGHSSTAPLARNP